MNRRAIRLGAVAALVFAAELSLPSHATLHVGVREVLACSGGGSPGEVAPPTTAAWEWLKPALQPSLGLSPVPVATDGFFVIDAEGQLTVDAAASSMQVVVTDETGQTVAGETKLLLNKRVGWYLFGWSASAPLPVGAKLQATLSATPVLAGASGQVGGQFALVVVGEPTPLPEPSLLFSWLDFYRGQQGATLSCERDEGFGTCGGPTTLSVPATIQKQTAADMSWRLPPITGGVAWLARLEAGADNDAELLHANPVDYWGDVPAGNDVALGRMVFPTPAEQPCATLVLTDLRTDEQQRVQRCLPPERTEAVDSDTDLRRCKTPPSADLSDLWCRLKPDSGCEAGGGSGGSAPQGGPVAGSGSVGAGSGPVPSRTDAEGAEPDSEANAATRGPRTSQGCQLGGSASSGGGHAVWLLLLGLLARRRR